MGSEMSSLHDDDGLVVEEVPNMQLVQQADGTWKVFVDGEEVIVAEIEVRPLSDWSETKNPWIGGTSGDTIWVDTSNQKTYTTGTTSTYTADEYRDMQNGEEYYTLQGSNSGISFQGDLVLSKDQIKKLKDDLGLATEDD